MSEQTTPKHHFIDYLESLREADDRGALAALRRGLGQPPGGVPDMFPYVVRHLPKGAKWWEEANYYLIASLFALYPESSSDGNMGHHFARARAKTSDDVAIERRFVALLAAHRDDLPTYLRQAVSFLRSKEVPINWHQLMWDLRRWESEPSSRGRSVQQWWANAFWATPRKEQPETE